MTSADASMCITISIHQRRCQSSFGSERIRGFRSKMMGIAAFDPPYLRAWTTSQAASGALRNGYRCALPVLLPCLDNVAGGGADHHAQWVSLRSTTLLPCLDEVAGGERTTSGAKRISRGRAATTCGRASTNAAQGPKIAIASGNPYLRERTPTPIDRPG